MFRAARLKLTAWYLLIIMTISVAFSVVIYTWTSLEIERFARNQRFRIERRYDPDGLFFQDVLVPPPTLTDPELIADTKHRIIAILAGINTIIFVMAGGLGYVLSGKTLAPISQMLEDQRRFISDASHELRTPLAALQSSLEVNIRDPHLTIGEVKPVMKAQLAQVNELHALAEQLLHLNKSEQPITVQKNSLFNSQVSLEKAVETIKPLAQLKNISVDSHLQPITLYGSPESLHEVATILLDNAVKYSHSNSSISITSKAANHHFQLTVSDHGVGIAKKDQPYIFDRFYRSDQARSNDDRHGFGLGLAIAKEIVTHQHGTITVSSVVDKGTTFTVTIPLP